MVIFQGKVGDVSYELDGEAGQLKVKLGYALDPIALLEHLKAAIPGNIDDVVISFLEQMLKDKIK